MIATSQVTVGFDAPVALTTPGNDDIAGQYFMLTPAAATVYVGDQDVTSDNGFPVAAGGILDTELDGGETVYGICGGSDSTSVGVFQSGV